MANSLFVQMSSIPARFIFSPPTPMNSISGLLDFKESIKSAPNKSPESSPAMSAIVSFFEVVSMVLFS